MWEWAQELFRSNKDAIRQGILSFLLIGVIGIVIGWYVTDLIYEPIIKGKDATIEALKAQLQGRQDSIKTIVFDDTGKILINVGAEKLIEEFKVQKFKEGVPFDFVITLRTKEHLQHIPRIQSISANNQVAWQAERKDDNTIVWNGYWMMSNDSSTPEFKMEIYQTR